MTNENNISIANQLQSCSQTDHNLQEQVENPTSLKMYHPISLCNVAYKTITKVIANRLQTILPQLFGSHQTSFVPRRHITENIVIAQEVVNSMRRKSGNRGFMAIKVDLEKAYDRLCWDFINETLCEAHIPSGLIQVIMACKTSASMRVLWNGENTESFKPSRGSVREILYPLISLCFVLKDSVMGSLMLLARGNGVLSLCLEIVSLCPTSFLLTIFFCLLKPLLSRLVLFRLCWTPSVTVLVQKLKSPKH